MDYDLARLGTREFEHLSQALSLKVLGPSVEVFGDGPDGGREASFRGQSTWDTQTARPETWNGYHVLQAKFRQRPRGTGPDTGWLAEQLRDELDRWLHPASKRRRPGGQPEYLMITTNVVLSATGTGGIQRIDELIGSYAQTLGLRGWRVWHYDTICRLLDDAADIRKAFSGLITPGDVLAGLHEMLVGQAADLGSVLRAHAAKDLRAEGSVRLRAGHDEEKRLGLADIAVDLPARRGREAQPSVVPAVAHIIGHGDQVLRPSIAGPDLAPHLVVVGGPGQGKTTLGQLIGQVYRTELVADTSTLGREVARAAAGIRTRLDEIGVPRPRSKRWPIRVELAAYADQIAGGANVHLLRWIAAQVSRRGSVDITAGQLKAWLGSWPWLLVLDGLDEVAAPHARELLMQQIGDLLVDAATDDADLLIVATTRPQGYTGEFDSDSYEHLHLEPLSAQQATDYATGIARARHPDDDELQRQVVERVGQAAREPLTARLMRTPLQVTIMSLLLERRPRPPQDRHGLFEAYYETIYAREAAKPGFLAQLLDERRRDVDALHERVGLQLQIASESEGDADAALPTAELRQLAISRLITEGHEPGPARELADQLVKAATDRLVLLIPKGDRDVGFEVRSLQEFLAARALVTGPDEDVLARLRVIGPASHWRNTWLLAAGRIFATREYLRPRLLGLLRELDSDSALTMVVPAGPQLAFDLLDDDLAVRSPQFRRQLLQLALEVFTAPPTPTTTGQALVLLDLAEDPGLRALIATALTQAMHGVADRRATAWLACVVLQHRTGALAARARQLRETTPIDKVQLAALREWDSLNHFTRRDDPGQQLGLVPTPRRLGDHLHTLLDTADLTGPAARAVATFLAELDRTRIPTVTLGDHHTCLATDQQHNRIPSHEGAAAVLTEPDAADAVTVALLDIPPEDWPAAAVIRNHIIATRQRLLVGADLADSV